MQLSQTISQIPSLRDRWHGSLKEDITFLSFTVLKLVCGVRRELQERLHRSALDLRINVLEKTLLAGDQQSALRTALLSSVSESLVHSTVVGKAKYRDSPRE